MFRVLTKTNMAAVEGIPEDKFCNLCEESITDRKNYRSLTSETAVCYYKYLQDLEVSSKGYLCRFCLTKLNRLIRLDKEIETKLEDLKKKRDELFSRLQAVRKELATKLPSERPKLAPHLSCGRIRNPRPQKRAIVPVSAKPPDLSKFIPILPLITQHQTADTVSPCEVMVSSLRNNSNPRFKKRKSNSADKDGEIKKMTTASDSTQPLSPLQSSNSSVVPNHPVLLFKNINTVSDDTFPAQQSNGTENVSIGTTNILTTCSEGTTQCIGQSPFVVQTAIRTNSDACNIVAVNRPHVFENNQVHVVDSENTDPKSALKNNVQYRIVTMNPPFAVKNTLSSVSESSEVERSTGYLQYAHTSSFHDSKEATPGEGGSGSKTKASPKKPSSSVIWGSPETECKVVKNNEVGQENNSETVEEESDGDVCPDTMKIKEEPAANYCIKPSCEDGDENKDDAEEGPQSEDHQTSPKVLCIKQEPKSPSNLDICKSPYEPCHSPESKPNIVDSKQSSPLRRTSGSSKDGPVYFARSVYSDSHHVPWTSLLEKDVDSTVDSQCTGKMKLKLLEKLKNKKTGSKDKSSQTKLYGSVVSLAECPSQCSSANSAGTRVVLDASENPISEGSKLSSGNVDKCEQDTLSGVSEPIKRLVLSPEFFKTLKVVKASKGTSANSTVYIRSKEGCESRGTGPRTGKGRVFTISVKPDGQTKSKVDGDIVKKLEPKWT